MNYDIFVFYFLLIGSDVDLKLDFLKVGIIFKLKVLYYYYFYNNLLLLNKLRFYDYLTNLLIKELYFPIFYIYLNLFINLLLI